jgi:tRNA modification GTPase
MNAADTIAAISSAVGTAPRMIVRISGPAAPRLARELTGIEDPPPPPASATRVTLTPPGIPAHVYTFRAPHSYTAEDLVEFHIPGSPVLARMLLDELVRRGARHADPGEFTARAYFNGRLDLSRAEGVAATIGAQSDREARAARQLLAGELARRVQPLMDDIAQALALTEVGIDFTDEDVTFISPDDLTQRCRRAIDSIDTLLRESPRFERLAHEPRIVLVGRPNAGKSTLLNTLAGQTRAVVSNTPGTTRDALTAHITLPRGTVQLIDVAGLEDQSATDNGPRTTDVLDSIHRQMQSHALRELESADVVILVQDPATNQPPLSLPRPPDLVVHAKSDLGTRNSAISTGISVSSHTGQGLPELRQRLDTLAFGHPADEGTETSPLALNARHVRSLEQAKDALARATDAAQAGPELAALELRAALDALGSVLGQLSPDDLLGKIFSQFCIGK